METKNNIILNKIIALHWGFIAIMTIISIVGFTALYSASGGNLSPWASKQIIHFLISIPIMLAISIVDIRFWYQFAHVAYIVGIALLLLVAVAGVEGGLGAQRWLSIGGFRFQPSEIMKVCLILSLARYFHNIHLNSLRRLVVLVVPLSMIAFAVVLVLKQPNLGTSAIIAMASASVLFVSGIGWKKFAIAGIVALAMLPVAWSNMHDYQKKRVETFLNPQSDPLGAGYNIIQSKIAIGSGGMFGRGFLKGTQSRLNFVPEKQTDFIFAIIAEEFGFVGGIALISLYIMLIACSLGIAIRCKSSFGRITSCGIITILFLHVFINIGMVTGILPVVGVPLPLISYGGSSMMSTIAGFGFILNAHVHENVII